MYNLSTITPEWWAILLLSVLLLVSLILVLLLYRRLRRFEAAHQSLQTLSSGRDLDALLQELAARSTQLFEGLADCEARVGQLEQKARKLIQGAELLRFNAFDNMGSDLSFALALLNEEGDGVVLSSIHSREESRVYAKPIRAGQSQYQLSDEERKVISRVTGQSGPNPK